MLASTVFGAILTAFLLCWCAFTAVLAELRLWTRPARAWIYVVTVVLVIAWCGLVLYRFLAVD